MEVSSLVSLDMIYGPGIAVFYVSNMSVDNSIKSVTLSDAVSSSA